MGRKPKDPMRRFDPVYLTKRYVKGVFSVLDKKDRTKERYDKTFMDELLNRRKY
jgi:hypothetical protein